MIIKKSVSLLFCHTSYVLKCMRMCIFTYFHMCTQYKNLRNVTKAEMSPDVLRLDIQEYWFHFPTWAYYMIVQPLSTPSAVSLQLKFQSFPSIFFSFCLHNSISLPVPGFMVHYSANCTKWIASISFSIKPYQLFLRLKWIYYLPIHIYILKINNLH